MVLLIQNKRKKKIHVQGGGGVFKRILGILEENL